jgi:hypothetical protein
VPAPRCRLLSEIIAGRGGSALSSDSQQPSADRGPPRHFRAACAKIREQARLLRSGVVVIHLAPSRKVQPVVRARQGGLTKSPRSPEDACFGLPGQLSRATLLFVAQSRREAGQTSRKCKTKVEYLDSGRAQAGGERQRAGAASPSNYPLALFHHVAMTFSPCVSLAFSVAQRACVAYDSSTPVDHPGQS